MLFVRQASQRQLRKYEDMLWMQVRDLLLKGMPAGALEDGRRPQNYVQKDPGAHTQDVRRRKRVVGECRRGRRGVENKFKLSTVCEHLYPGRVPGSGYYPGKLHLLPGKCQVVLIEEFFGS